MNVISRWGGFHDNLHKFAHGKRASTASARLLKLGVQPPQFLRLPFENRPDLFNRWLPDGFSVIKLPVRKVCWNAFFVHGWTSGLDALVSPTLRQAVAVLTDTFHCDFIT